VASTSIWSRPSPDQRAATSSRRGIITPDVLADQLSVDQIGTNVNGDNYDRVRTAAVAIENTHVRSGGRAWRLAELDALSTYLGGLGVALHCDGARLWNASVATGTPLDEYGRRCSTLSVCLSKSLGTPVGSLVVTNAARAERFEQNPCLAMVFDGDGRLRLVAGSPGGKARVETVRQLLVNVLDFGLNVQRAVDTGRFLVSPDGASVDFEARYGDVDPGLRHALEARGHVVLVKEEAFGSGQAIAIDPATGALMAGADWRRESVALAY